MVKSQEGCVSKAFRSEFFMTVLDIGILVLYLVTMLGVGLFFMKRNNDVDDYSVGGRKLGSFHVGLSVVATDVGGGFSIGLGGLGFVMGLSGSWLLFTGLIGAWLAAVLLIPRVKKLEETARFYTFPKFLIIFMVIESLSSQQLLQQ